MAGASSIPRRRDWSLYLTFLAVLVSVLCCFSVSKHTNHLKTRWPGVAPAPSEPVGLLYGFGDRQLSYYSLTLTLQNMGDIGGRMTALKDYNMENVADWLWLTYRFDKNARYAPTLASYYFGATQDPSKLRPVINYLRVVGNRPDRELWRFMAQAVYLARFRLKDDAFALELAYQLAAIPGDLPIWTKQMPAFVMSRAGQKKASRDLFLTLIASGKDLSIQEINFMCGYIADNLREQDDQLETNEVWKAFCTGRKY